MNIRFYILNLIAANYQEQGLAMFSPAMCNVYDRAKTDDLCTPNMLEGWHHHFNMIITAKHHPNIFECLDRQRVKQPTLTLVSSNSLLGKPRDISGPEYRWALKVGQRPISHSFTYKNQYFDGPFCIFMGLLKKMMGPRILNRHLTAK